MTTYTIQIEYPDEELKRNFELEFDKYLARETEYVKPLDIKITINK